MRILSEKINGRQSFGKDLINQTSQYGHKLLQILSLHNIEYILAKTENKFSAIRLSIIFFEYKNAPAIFKNKLSRFSRFFPYFTKIEHNFHIVLSKTEDSIFYIHRQSPTNLFPLKHIHSVRAFFPILKIPVRMLQSYARILFRKYTIQINRQ